MVICCMAQETQTGALYQPRGVGCRGRWDRGSKGRGYMYTYGWFMLRFDRKPQYSVRQLSFNKKNYNKNTFQKKIVQTKWKCKENTLIVIVAGSSNLLNTYHVPNAELVFYIVSNSHISHSLCRKSEVQKFVS